MRGESEVKSAAPMRRIEYEYSRSLVGILQHHRISLLVTTYQAGKLVVIGTREDSPELLLYYRNLTSPMGVAVRPETDSLAVATETQIWQFGNKRELAARLDPPGTHDACYLPRRAIYTGPIDAHEIAWCGNDLWIVNTAFSCLCTLDGVHNFVPRWKPSFISTLAAQDRCHLNGLCIANDRPGYVTALGETDTREGWRTGKAAGGCVIEVSTGSTVIRGLSMPHSPRIYNGELLLLESGRGRLVRAERPRGAVVSVAELPGYARGMAFAGPFAFVGLSKFRSSSTPKATFDNLPISERTTPMSCGISVVDIGSGREVSRLEFHAGIDEIFDVQPLRHTRNPWVSGPHHNADEVATIWVLPELRGF